jgi:hypothetical protein
MLGTCSSHTAEFYPDGHAGDVRRMSLKRALHRFASAPNDASYAFVPLRPRHWRRLLSRLDMAEPGFATRSRLPEAECEGALAPANLTWPFERSLRWRMLTLGGSAGAGMRLHVDSPPTSSWHVQVRGRKQWALCPPADASTYCDGRASAFEPTTKQACAAFANASCLVATLSPGESVFYPEGWWHQTRTLTAGAVSLSRSLVTPSNAAGVARALRKFCAAGLDFGHEWCAPMLPCLRRLVEVRDPG